MPSAADERYAPMMSAQCRCLFSDADDAGFAAAMAAFAARAALKSMLATADIAVADDDAAHA